MKAGKEAELCWVRTGDRYSYGNGYYEDSRQASYRGSDPYYWDIGYNQQHGYYSYNHPHEQPPMTHYYPHASYSYPYHC